MNKNKVYLDPHSDYRSESKEEENEKYFFRIKRKYLDEFWKMTDREILLLVSIWQYNKEWSGNLRKYLIDNEELRTLIIGKDKFEIAEKDNYRAIKKFEEIGIIKVEGDKRNRKIFYDFEKQEGKKKKGQKGNGFINIPLNKIRHYLQEFGITNIKTYIFMLYIFYNDYNHARSNPPYRKYYGIRKLIMSQKRIGQKIGKSKQTVYRHIKKLEEAEFIDIVKENGLNVYYLPIYFIIRKDDITYYDTKTNKKIHESKSKSKPKRKDLWENSSGERKPYEHWERLYGDKIEIMKDQKRLRRVV
jgi:DNA-binding transcriptional ArsR family regulator